MMRKYQDLDGTITSNESYIIGHNINFGRSVITHFTLDIDEKWMIYLIAIIMEFERCPS